MTPGARWYVCEIRELYDNIVYDNASNQAVKICYHTNTLYVDKVGHLFISKSLWWWCNLFF